MGNSTEHIVAGAAFSRLAILLILLCIQLITTSGIMPDIPDNHLRYVYLVAVTLLSAAALLPMRKMSIVIDMIDISIYESIFYVYGFIIIAFFPAKYDSLYPDALWVWFPSFTFLVTICRLLFPPVIANDVLPALGIIGYLSKRPTRWGSIWPTSFIVVSVIASAVLAANVSHLQQGWSRWALAIATIVTVAAWGRPMLAVILAFITAKHDGDAREAALRAEFADQAAQLEVLKDSLAHAARKEDACDVDSAKALIANKLSEDDLRLIELISILRPDVKAYLVDFVIDISKEHRKPALRRVK